MRSSINLSTSEKLGIISNLATMLSAGIPILETVDSLIEDSRGSQKKLLETLREDLMQGKHISSSFENFPNIFDKITINLIKASEEGGTLDVTLKDLTETIRRDTEFKDKIKGALVYPLIILIVFAGVLGMILIVVVPKISTVFSRLNVTLPLPTQILITMSNLLIHSTVYVAIGTVAAVSIIVFIFKTQKRFISGVFFAVPLISDLIKQIDLTRFTRSMFLLLNAGIPITSSLELAQDVVMRSDVSKAIVTCREMVLSGKKLSEGLKANKGVFPSIMLRMTEAGEKSGSLEKSMQDASNYLDYQVSNTLKVLTTLMEPIMLVFVGVLVGGMMLAIISPIYGLIGQVGTR